MQLLKNHLGGIIAIIGLILLAIGIFTTPNICMDGACDIEETKTQNFLKTTGAIFIVIGIVIGLSRTLISRTT